MVIRLNSIAKKLYLDASRISQTEDYVVEDVFDLLWVFKILLKYIFEGKIVLKGKEIWDYTK